MVSSPFFLSLKSDSEEKKVRRHEHKPTNGRLARCCTFLQSTFVMSFLALLDDSTVIVLLENVVLLGNLCFYLSQVGSGDSCGCLVTPRLWGVWTR